MIKLLFKFKIVSLVFLMLLLHCQRKLDVWSKMSENVIAAHTDSTPHFLPLHHEVYDLLETRIPHIIATNGLRDDFLSLFVQARQV